MERKEQEPKGLQLSTLEDDELESLRGYWVRRLNEIVREQERRAQVEAA